MCSRQRHLNVNVPHLSHGALSSHNPTTHKPRSIEQYESFI
jgi:hypothetical protein